VKTIAAILFAAVAAGALFLLLKPDKQQRPLSIALWYWHTPFEVPESELELLKAAGIDTLYVRAATIADKDGPVATLRQRWLSAPMGIKVHLVFRFDRSMVSALERRPNLDDEISTIVKAHYERAMARGVKVVGVQLDLDCPTRLLPTYAKLARKVKEAIDPLLLSLTALPTWYTSDDVQQLAEAVDFLVPQFYENNVGSHLDDLRPISSISTISSTLNAADRIGHRYMAGLPAYGRALMYDEKGRLAGVQNDISARKALVHPSFKLLQAFAADEAGEMASEETFCGEEVLDLVAAQPAPNGRGKGYHLVYLLPTPQLVIRHVRFLREAGVDCEGLILFRYPERSEQSTIPLSALVPALNGVLAEPSIRVSTEVRKSAHNVLDDPSAREETVVLVYARNVGNGSTSVHPEALVLTLQMNGGKIEDMVAEEADSVAVGAMDGGAFVRTSLARADALRITRFHLAPGEKVKLLTLRVKGYRAMDGSWSARLPGGFKKLSGGMTPPQVLK
jgi:hypothetical protein